MRNPQMPNSALPYLNVTTRVPTIYYNNNFITIVFNSMYCMNISHMLRTFKLCQTDMPTMDWL